MYINIYTCRYTYILAAMIQKRGMYEDVRPANYASPPAATAWTKCRHAPITEPSRTCIEQTSNFNKGTLIHTCTPTHASKNKQAFPCESVYLIGLLSMRPTCETLPSVSGLEVLVSVALSFFHRWRHRRWCHCRRRLREFESGERSAGLGGRLQCKPYKTPFNPKAGARSGWEWGLVQRECSGCMDAGGKLTFKWFSSVSAWEVHGNNSQSQCTGANFQLHVPPSAFAQPPLAGQAPRALAGLTTFGLFEFWSRGNGSTEASTPTP